MKKHILLGVFLGFVAALAVFITVIAPNLPENLVNNVVVMGATALITGVFLWVTVWMVLRLLTSKITRKDFADFLIRRGLLIAGIILALVLSLPGFLTAWAMKTSPNAYIFLQWKKELDLPVTTFMSSLVAAMLVIVSAILVQVIVNQAVDKERTGRVLFSLAVSFLQKDADLHHVRNLVEHPNDAHNLKYFWMFVMKFRLVIQELRRLGEQQTSDLLLRAFEDQLNAASALARKQHTEEELATLLGLAGKVVKEDNLAVTELPSELVSVMVEMGIGRNGAGAMKVTSNPDSARIPTIFFERK